ncbi:MAG TPA: glycosyltransferase family 4 protein [Tepidisphaeraceae bacterium]|jgi:UDP-glucose:(heptosyl)LPS alpha-1,3-glucosyltransferase
MKLALVILHADPARGGAEHYTIDLAAALVARGHEVSLLATSFANVPPGVKSIPLNASGWSRKASYLHALDALDSHLDRTRYDIIHAMLPVHRCDLYHPHAGLATAAILEKPFTTLFNPRRAAMAKIERHLLYAPHPPRVLCLSEYIKRAVKKHYPLNDAHLPILFNAVDIKRFAPRPKEPKSDRSIALMIAHDFERKGLKEAIAAMAKVDSKLTLRVVGKQPTAAYERLANRLGVRDRIDFAGPTSDPVSEYAKADFFVLPTKHDPCSLVVLEALAMGLPVISTHFNGACEIMTEGMHGFILGDPSDVTALTQAMQKMLDSELRKRMSAACIDLRPKLSYEHHLDRLTQIYGQSAVQSRAPKPSTPSPSTLGEGRGEGSSATTNGSAVVKEPPP